MTKKKSIQNYYLSKSRRMVKNLIKRVFDLKDAPRRIKTTSFIFDFNRYALIRRAKHEELTGMKESDYGSVKINWDLFADISQKRQSEAEFKNKEYKLKDRSIQSTYFPNRKSRITWD